MAERITQAIVLAAGEGQRLKPFTTLMPKVMLPIAGKPILQYVIEALAENGIRRIILVVGYRKEQVQDYFESGQNYGVEIEYVLQPQQLGVGHAIKQVKDYADERFLVAMGDNIIDPDTIEPLALMDSDALLVKPLEDSSRYKAVIVNDHFVSDIVVPPSEQASGLVDIGIYNFGRELFNFMGQEVRLTPMIRNMIASGHRILAMSTDGFWQDAVYPWDLIKLNDSRLSEIEPSIGGTIEESVSIKDPVVVGNGTIIRSNCYIVGPVSIGENCEIGPNVCIFPSTSIGNGVLVSPFTILRNDSIGNNVSIGPCSNINNSIVAAGTNIGSHFGARSSDCHVRIENEYYATEMGAIIGNYCRIGDNTIIEPGVIVGNNCSIDPLKLIGKNLPDNCQVI